METGPANIDFTVYREADFNKTVGFYRMDNAEGSVTDPVTGNILSPDDDGYKAAAIANQLDVN